MSRVLNYVPRVAIFLAGVAAAAITLPRRRSVGMDPAIAEDLKRSLAGLEVRLQDRETADAARFAADAERLAADAARLAADAARFAQVESRLEEHAARLADVPSTSQIVAAMEQLLSKTMSSLDDRLTTQANSIDVLKTTVSQTDSLLERVLESLDSLQTYTDPADFASDPLLSHARM
jgi:chromosome segregation ATPase